MAANHSQDGEPEKKDRATQICFLYPKSTKILHLQVISCYNDKIFLKRKEKKQAMNVHKNVFLSNVKNLDCKILLPKVCLLRALLSHYQI